IAAVSELEAAGLLVHDKKKPGNRHWQSWFRATESLMNLETKLQYRPVRNIILRDEDKVDIGYNVNDRRILKLDREIAEINAYLSKQVISLHGEVLKEGDPLYVDLHCVTGAIRHPLRRIFSDGSFYKGGRFYNDIQNIPTNERRW